MKLRMKGNSLRVRLTKSEVARLADTDYVEEQIIFPGNKFIYALQSIENLTQLSATLHDNKITMLVPKLFVQNWANSGLVGIDAKQQISENDWLTLLLEKDFVCNDESTEDQSDNFENPNKTC